MITYIYTLECPIKHTIFYVGKTGNVKERYHTHCKPNSRGGKKITNYLIYLRRQQLKPILDIIDQSEEDDWSWLEKYWISQLKAWGFKLLNTTDGGEKKYHYNHSEETKMIIRDKQKGRKQSEEWCNNISKGRLGIKFSKEHIENLSKSHKGKGPINVKKPVYKLNKNFEILDKYESITDALDSLNVPHDAGSISKVCKGKLKSSLGYYWRYVDDYNKLLSQPELIGTLKTIQNL